MNVLECALKHYGVKNQVQKAVEELTELSLELQRYLEGRGDAEHIREEMADVAVMMAQLEIVFGGVVKWATMKLNRLMENIGSPVLDGRWPNA
jgi:NTP pyrophosphatase (non-canonical NTP hydrolase)